MSVFSTWLLMLLFYFKQKYRLAKYLPDSSSDGKLTYCIATYTSRRLYCNNHLCFQNVLNLVAYLQVNNIWNLGLLVRFVLISIYKEKRLKRRNLEMCFPVWMVRRKYNFLFLVEYFFFSDSHEHIIVSWTFQLLKNYWIKIYGTVPPNKGFINNNNYLT